jgi:hypothetical protein
MRITAGHYCKGIDDLCNTKNLGAFFAPQKTQALRGQNREGLRFCGRNPSGSQDYTSMVIITNKRLFNLF